MKENFPNLVKEIDIQVQEAQKVPNKLDSKRTTPRHIIIKMPKVKDKEIIFTFFKRFYLFTYFLRGGREEKKRGRKISMCGCLSRAPTRDLARNPGMCPG